MSSWISWRKAQENMERPFLIPAVPQSWGHSHLLCFCALPFKAARNSPATTGPVLKSHMHSYPQKWNRLPTHAVRPHKFSCIASARQRKNLTLSPTATSAKKAILRSHNQTICFNGLKSSIFRMTHFHVSTASSEIPVRSSSNMQRFVY